MLKSKYRSILMSNLTILYEILNIDGNVSFSMDYGMCQMSLELTLD